MSVRLQIAGMLFLMIQAVFFGAGAVFAITTGLIDHGFGVMTAVTVISAMLAAPLSWLLAVRLRTHVRGYRLAG